MTAPTIGGTGPTDPRIASAADHEQLAHAFRIAQASQDPTLIGETGRPTPERIIKDVASMTPSVVINALTAHGYRIVHPDDVPVRAPTPDDQRTAAGWNACVAFIFGEGT